MMKSNSTATLAKKELGMMLNAPATYVIAVVFLMITGWFFVAPLFQNNQSTLDSFFGPLPLVFTFLVPALTMRAFAEEYRSGTIEYLSTLPLRDWEIVLSKYIAAMSLLGLLLVFTLAYPLVLFMIGRPDPGQIVGGYVALIGLGSLYSAIGLWASSLTRNQVVSFIISFFVCFAFFVLSYLANIFPDWLASFIRGWSVDTHFSALARGVLDSRDLLYWASSTFFFSRDTLRCAFEAMAMSVSMQERRRNLAFTSVTGLLLLGFIVILLNVVANWSFVRWDMTSSHAYSLSPSSKRLMRGLDDPFIVKAYFTPDLPPPYNSYERYVRDMLTEYRAASHGRLQFQFMPTNPPATFEKEAGAAGLAAVQFEQMGSDQLAIHRGFMGLALYYGDKTDTLPVVKDIQSLEYDLTSRIARMTLKSKKTILLTTGHGESSWHTDPNSKLSQDVSSLYNIQTVSLQPATTASLQGDALFIIGPNQKFDDQSLWVIDQAIMHGIPTAFLIDTKNVMVQRFAMLPLTTGLNELVAHYGAVVGSQMVYDAQCQTVGLTQNYGGMSITSSVRYPFIPLISQLDTKNPILRGLDTVALPFSMTVDPAPGLSSAIHFTPLFKTTSQSWLTPAETYNISPAVIPQPKPDEPHGPYNLGGLLEGSFASYFQGKPLPFPGQVLTGTSPQTQIFVLGTSHVLDPGMSEFPGMEALLTNLMAYLSHDETLLGIRAKGEIMRPLKPISTAEREIVKLFCVIGVAFLPVILGLLRWQRRSRWRDEIRARFVPAPVAAVDSLPPPPVA